MLLFGEDGSWVVGAEEMSVEQVVGHVGGFLLVCLADEESFFAFDVELGLWVGWVGKNVAQEGYEVWKIGVVAGEGEEGVGGGGAGGDGSSVVVETFAEGVGGYGGCACIDETHGVVGLEGCGLCPLSAGEHEGEACDV